MSAIITMYNFYDTVQWRGRFRGRLCQQHSFCTQERHNEKKVTMNRQLSNIGALSKMDLHI